MPDTTRRDLLTTAGALTALGATALLDGTNRSDAALHAGRAELLAALSAWRAHEVTDPAQVLRGDGILGMAPEEISERTRREFRTGDTIQVEGLVLSRTEVALLAALALLPLSAANANA